MYCSLEEPISAKNAYITVNGDKNKEQRGRENYHVENFGIPRGNFIDIDTSIDTPEESLLKVRKAIKL